MVCGVWTIIPSHLISLGLHSSAHPSHHLQDQHLSKALLIPHQSPTRSHRNPLSRNTSRAICTTVPFNSSSTSRRDHSGSTHPSCSTSLGSKTAGERSTRAC